MKHFRVAHTPEDIERVNKSRRSTAVQLSPSLERGKPACLKQMEPDDELVDAALASECDECRTAIGVALAGNRGLDNKAVGVHEEPKWEAQPMADAEFLIESAMKNRG